MHGYDIISGTSNFPYESNHGHLLPGTVIVNDIDNIEVQYVPMDSSFITIRSYISPDLQSTMTESCLIYTIAL